MFYESKKIQFRPITYIHEDYCFVLQTILHSCAFVFYIAIAIWFLKNQTSNETFCKSANLIMEILTTSEEIYLTLRGNIST